VTRSTAEASASVGPEAATDAVSEAVASTRDSIVVALWTAVSRATGLIRVAVIAAVLGPTFLGNTYQFTNSVPNLVYYGLLGGALVSSLLVPALVRNIAGGRPDEVAATARGLFGCALSAAAVAVPILIVGVPLVLRSTNGATSDVAHAQIRAATWLVVMLAPQIVCYAVIACSVAVMNAHRRFAIASAAPTIENAGSLIVLGLVWAVYGTGHEVTDVPSGEIVLLGLGTTAAVVAHAAVQWYGARRSGVALVPRRGWRDPAVRVIAVRSGFAVGQAGLWAIQLIVAIALANRLAGGVVAVLIATNFFFLPVALAATPIALSALPRLAAHHAAGREHDFADAALRALTLVVFIAAPAAAGYLVLAPRLAEVVTFGSSSTVGARELVTVALAALAVGVIGTSVFTVATYISYARDDARTPLSAMLVQTVVAITVMAFSVTVHGSRSLLFVTGGLAIGGLIGAAVLVHRLRLPQNCRARLLKSATRTGACVAVMTPCVWLCSHLLGNELPGRGGQFAALGVAVAVGVGVYGLAQRAAHSPELALVTASVGGRRRAPHRAARS
jgi:putative peptidoglycan lipid II flippase